MPNIMEDGPALPSYGKALAARIVSRDDEVLISNGASRYRLTRVHPALARHEVLQSRTMTHPEVVTVLKNDIVIVAFKARKERMRWSFVKTGYGKAGWIETGYIAPIPFHLPHCAQESGIETRSMLSPIRIPIAITRDNGFPPPAPSYREFVFASGEHTGYFALGRTTYSLKGINHENRRRAVLSDQILCGQHCILVRKNEVVTYILKLENEDGRWSFVKTSVGVTGWIASRSIAPLREGIYKPGQAVSRPVDEALSQSRKQKRSIAARKTDPSYFSSLFAIFNPFRRCPKHNPIHASSTPQWLLSNAQCREWLTAVLVDSCGWQPPTAKKKANDVFGAGLGMMIFETSKQTWVEHLGIRDGMSLWYLVNTFRHEPGAQPADWDWVRGEVV